MLSRVRFQILLLLLKINIRLVLYVRRRCEDVIRLHIRDEYFPFLVEGDDEHVDTVIGRALCELVGLEPRALESEDVTLPKEARDLAGEAGTLHRLREPLCTFYLLQEFTSVRLEIEEKQLTG